MIAIDLTYEGDLRCTLTHAPSGTVLTTDAPLDNMGRGESFSPTDLCATSLVSCMVTTMAILARKRGFELGSCTAQVHKIMSSSPPRRITQLPVSIHLEGRYSTEELSILREAAMTCPVKLSLHDSIDISVNWIIGGENTPLQSE